MSEEPQTMRQIIIDLAKDVAKTAKKGDTAFAEQIDALKTLTTLYTTLQKHKDGEEDETARDGFNFEQGTEPAEETSHARADTVTPIRARQRPGARTPG